MLSLKVSKQTRTEASKNKVTIKSIKHINRISKSKQIINQIKFSNITNKHITKNSRNLKLKEKYYLNKETHLAIEKYVYFSTLSFHQCHVMQMCSKF